MATKLTDTQTTTTTGTKTPATMTKFPEFGATFTADLSGGTSPTATVQIRAWNVSMTTKEILGTIVLPVSGGLKNGDAFDSLPVFSTWDNWDWNVVAITGSGTLRLSAVGVGV
jgi:hypothetical protein